MRALYSCEDLETSAIALSSRHPKAIGLVQGRFQLVLGDFVEVVHLDNILQVRRDIARVQVTKVSVPILTHNARWLRDDISVVRVVNSKGKTLFKIDKVCMPRTASHETHVTECTSLDSTDGVCATRTSAWCRTCTTPSRT